MQSQCGENIFNLFDKICVIYDGQMVYMGPRQRAVEYFKEMGYEPQPRQTSVSGSLVMNLSWSRTEIAS